MPRYLRSLDPSASPLTAFAAELRKLHEEAGSPKFLQMARRTGKSRTALTEAVGGDHLPTWETVAAFVTACGSEPNDWRARWEDARDQSRVPTNSEENVRAELAVEPTGPDAPEPASRTAIWMVGAATRYTVVALASAAVAVGITLAATSSREADSTQPMVTKTPADEAIIKVQNMVALGANELVEDATPAYLSTEPAPFCATKKCKVEGTELASGATLIAVCYVHGVEMFNYNLDSSESKTNPHRSRSTVWYKAIFPGGKAGFLSEVYIAPEHRGGLGLSICTASTTSRSISGMHSIR